MSTPHTQVKLKLTEDPEILSSLRRHNALKTDAKGDCMVLQFDAFEYRFYPGVEIIVPAPVAEGLYRSSGVLIGDSLSGVQHPGLQIVEKWELGDQEPSRKVSKTVCSICQEDQKSVKKLAAHLASHVEEEEAEVEEEEK